jgi:hypothetical protein
VVAETTRDDPDEGVPMRISTLTAKVVTSAAAAGAGLVLLLGADPAAGPRPAAPVVVADCGQPVCPTASGGDDAHWG